MDKPDRLEIASDYHTFELLHSIEFKGTSTWDFEHIYIYIYIDGAKSLKKRHNAVGVV